MRPASGARATEGGAAEQRPIERTMRPIASARWSSKTAIDGGELLATASLRQPPQPARAANEQPGAADPPQPTQPR